MAKTLIKLEANICLLAPDWAGKFCYVQMH
jgi:hypothetical protein